MQSRDDNRKLVFEWDEGNNTKSWEKHEVTNVEAEQIFFNAPLVVKKDVKHSRTEERFYALGKTDSKRYLFVAFTIRKGCLRVISARPMNRYERRYYQTIKLH